MKFDKGEQSKDRAPYLRQWHQDNKERRSLERKLRWLDPEYRAAQSSTGKKWADKNREKVRAKSKKWRDKNKPYNAIRMGKYRIKRRSMERAATVNLEQIHEWVKRVQSRGSNKCYYCRGNVPLESLHFDHVIPISKGGQHSVDNLCVSCAHCNQTKSATLVGDYKYHPQLFLNL